MGLFGKGDYKVAEDGWLGATISSGLTEGTAMATARDESRRRNRVVVVKDKNGDVIARFNSGNCA